MSVKYVSHAHLQRNRKPAPDHNVISSMVARLQGDRDSHSCSSSIRPQHVSDLNIHSSMVARLQGNRDNHSYSFQKDRNMYKIMIYPALCMVARLQRYRDNHSCSSSKKPQHVKDHNLLSSMVARLQGDRDNHSCSSSKRPQHVQNHNLLSSMVARLQGNATTSHVRLQQNRRKHSNINYHSPWWLNYKKSVITRPVHNTKDHKTLAHHTTLFSQEHHTLTARWALYTFSPRYNCVVL